MTPQRFRKNPVEIEAMQIQIPSDCSDIARWINREGGKATPEVMSPTYAVIYIDTLEGRMMAVPGDWVIRGVAGEFYPCRDDIFEKTYERA